MHHDKDPTTWSSDIWVLAIVMSLLGGAVSLIQRLPCPRARPFGVKEATAEMATSGFVGLLAFMALEALDTPVGVCAALSGVAGHMATRLLFLVENMIEQRIKNKAGMNDGEQ